MSGAGAGSLCSSRALICLALLSAGCRTPSAAPDPGPSLEQQEAVALLERARREVEQARPEVPQAAGELHVPANAAGQLPLIVFLHGLGGSGAELSSGLHLLELSAELGFAFQAPDGMLDYSGRRFWNASESCCNFDRLEVDHVALLRDWIGTSLKHPKLDPARVYLVGYSNGGFLAYRAACELGSLLRGIFSIGGAGSSDAGTCHPDPPALVVEIHGDQDAIVSFTGGYLFADRRRPKHPSAEVSLRPWRERNGCSEPAVPRENLDLDPRIPGAETEVLSFPGCTQHAVELWRIRGGDHSSGLSRNGVRAIWQAIQADGRRAAPR
ncbi:MAG TPA: PHB depolymerase family esterase [Polyangiaceae bacterium]|nr:PHB depolymerase family esterase [Polyangiaceae bacterium]